MSIVSVVIVGFSTVATYGFPFILGGQWKHGGLKK
jgi:hypothetical protein